MTTAALLLAHAAAAWAMTGVIWVVQLSLYPSFHAIGAAGDREFAAAMARHQRGISWFVLPVMLVEATATALLFGQPLGWLGALLLLLVWGVTFGREVPRHQRLLHGYQSAVVAGLVRDNWWRTLGWSGRAALATWWLWTAMPASMAAV